MGSRVRLQLAEALRAGLDEFAERWVKFIKVNDLAPDSGEPQEEEINRARLGFEVLANLLEDADYSKFENVVRRLLHDWINRAASCSELIAIEEAFPLFILPHLDIDPDSDEAEELVSAIREFFLSDIRAKVLGAYIEEYEEIIGAESRHTAYVLAHFDAILALSAHLNGAECRNEIISGLAPIFSNLFENVIATAIWCETPDSPVLRVLNILDEDIPPPVLEEGLTDRLLETFNIGEVRWIAEDDLPVGFRSLIGVEIQSKLSACVIPVRPREAPGILVALIVSGEHPGTLELSLSRVASAECALALERVTGREHINSVNRRIKDVLSLSRETAWGTGLRDTGELVLDYLLDLTGSTRALLLAMPTTSVGGSTAVPVASRGLADDVINSYRESPKLPLVVRLQINSHKGLLLPSERLSDILRNRKLPPGFEPDEKEAFGILPLDRSGSFQGICLYSCPVDFASEPETVNIMGLFARTAADSLAMARDYERMNKMAGIAEEDSTRARILQQRLTSRYVRSGRIVYWAHLQPAGDLAGDVLFVNRCPDGSLNVWAADVAGRGTSAGWSMILIRQLLSEIPGSLVNPAIALADINITLHDIESSTSPGIFATLVGLHLDDKNNLGRLARAGAPKIFRLTTGGTVQSIDPEGFPLGLFNDAQIEEAEFDFIPGDKLIWVSDGVLGIRDEHGNTFGEKKLIECIREASFLPARVVFERILASIGEFAASDKARDDWSLIVAGFDPEPDWQSSRPGGERNDLLDEALSWLRNRAVYSNIDLVAVRTVIGEALTNAHEHGNNYRDGAAIEVKLYCSPDHIHVKVRDEGGKLNERVTNPDMRPSKILEDKGRGFLLIRHQSDHLWVEEDRGELNAVRIVEK